MLDALKAGDKVFWTDPSGDASGPLVVLKVPDGPAGPDDEIVMDTPEGPVLTVRRCELSTLNGTVAETV